MRRSAQPPRRGSCRSRLPGHAAAPPRRPSARLLTRPSASGLLPASLAGLRVLELGAGIGRFTGLLAQTAAHVHAVDFMQNLIDEVCALATTGGRGAAQARNEAAQGEGPRCDCKDALPSGAVLHPRRARASHPCLPACAPRRREPQDGRTTSYFGC